MREKISSFDVFSITFSLDTKRGSGTYTTHFGGILTIFAFILFSIITIIVVSDYRDTTKPVVSVNRVREGAPPEINFSEYGIGNYIACLDTNFITMHQLKKYVTMRVDMLTTSEDAQGNRIEKVEPLNFDIVRRLKNQERKAYAEAQWGRTKEFGLDYEKIFGEVLILVDISLKEFYLTGSKFNLPYRRLRYRFYPCSLPNAADCTSVTDLSSLKIGSFGTFKVANYSNKKKPLKTFIDVDNVLFPTIGQTVRNFVYLKKNEIYDMDMIKERLTHTFVDADRYGSDFKTRLNPLTYCTVAQIDGGLCEPYTEIFWENSVYKTVIQRRYVTPFEAFSEVGGFWDLMVYFVLALYFYYNTTSYTRFVRSQLVEGFIEMDEKRLGYQKKRTKEELRRINTKLGEMKLEKEENSVDKLPFKEVFKTKVDFEKLTTLSFKSKILLEALIKHKLIFSTLATKMIFLQKKSEKSTKKEIFDKKFIYLTKTQKTGKNQSRVQNKKFDPLVDEFNKREELAPMAGKVDKASKNQNTDGKSQGGGLKEKERLILIDELGEFQGTENKGLMDPRLFEQEQQEPYISKGEKNKKFTILGSRQRSRTNIELKKNQKKINPKIRLNSRFSTFGKFGKKMGSKLRRR